MSNKNPKTYEEQLEILKKRNLKILDEKRAKKILSVENYYALINGYKEFFLKSSNPEVFQNNISFEDIFLLFDFDRELRMILLKYILIVERTIKTKISYYFSLKYSDDYLQINNFDVKNNNKNSKIPRLLHDMQKTIRKHSNELNTPINHYKRKYRRVPLWVLAEKLNFGTIAHFFNCLKTKDQNMIAHEIYIDYTEEYNYIGKSILNPTETSEILFFICDFRNKCAHDERTFSHRHKFASGSSPNPFIFKEENLSFNNNVFSLIMSLKIFLSKENFTKMTKEIDNLMDTLIIHLPNHHQKILKKMGIPKRWKNIIKK